MRWAMSNSSLTKGIATLGLPLRMAWEAEPAPAWWMLAQHRVKRSECGAYWQTKTSGPSTPGGAFSPLPTRSIAGRPTRRQASTAFEKKSCA